MLGELIVLVLDFRGSLVGDDSSIAHDFEWLSIL